MNTNTNVLREYAEGRIQHLNRGQCPDIVSGHDSRDPDCPVCAAITTAAAVPPEGWVMVPVEPTKEMIAHAHQACDGTYAGDVYRAMLAAAPKAGPVPAGEYPPLPSNIGHVTRRIRRCEGEAAAQLVLEYALRAYVDADRAMRAQAAPAAVAPPSTGGDLITIRKPTSHEEAKWLAKLAHLLVNDINGTLNELLAKPTTQAASAAATEIWAAAQLAPGEGIEDAVARIDALLTAPAAVGIPVVGCNECLITHDLGACITAPPHIQHPYTLAEIKAKIASHEYSAELLLQHAMLLLDRTAETRWYMVNKSGMATLCADREDAEREAETAQEQWPNCGPHRAVQLAEVEGTPHAAAPIDRELFERHVKAYTGRDMEYHERNGTTGLEFGWACWKAARRASPTPPAVVEPLTADDMKEPKSGQHWRVEWWNESCRMMLPTHMKLDRFQSFKNDTLMFTIKQAAHGIGIKKGDGHCLPT